MADFMASTATMCGKWISFEASKRNIKKEAERQARLLWSKEYEKLEEGSFKKILPDYGNCG